MVNLNKNYQMIKKNNNGTNMILTFSNMSLKYRQKNR